MAWCTEKSRSPDDLTINTFFLQPTPFNEEAQVSGDNVGSIDFKRHKFDKTDIAPKMTKCESISLVITGNDAFECKYYVTIWSIFMGFVHECHLNFVSMVGAWHGVREFHCIITLIWNPNCPRWILASGNPLYFISLCYLSAKIQQRSA